MRDPVFSLHHYYVITGDKSGSSLGTDSLLNQIKYTINIDITGNNLVGPNEIF